MRNILLLPSLLFICLSTSSANATGSGYITGEFSSIESMGEPVRTDPENYLTNPPAVYGLAESMYGTSTYRWGAWNGLEGGSYGWSSNELSFNETEFDNIPKGETFVAGTLNYSNGVARIGSSPSSVQLNLHTYSDQVDFNQDLSLEIAIISTPNNDANGNPLPQDQAADFIYFPMFPEFGSLRIVEDSYGSVEILASFNSLHFEGFGQVSSMEPGDAFLSPSINISTVPVPVQVSGFL